MGKASLRVDPGLIRKLQTWFIPRPANMFARVYGAQQSIATGDWTQTVTFDTERWDTGANSDYADGFWEGVTNPTRLTATVSGNYIITGHIEWAAAGGTMRGIGIKYTRPAVAAASIARHVQPPLDPQEESAMPMSIATAYWLRAGDYVELVVYQNSGAGLNILESANYSPEFTITRVP